MSALESALASMSRRAELLASATTPATCIHPAARLYAWWADDPSGPVLCVGCLDCGAVLAGGAELPNDVRDEEPIYF